MIVKLLTEYHLEFQSLKGGCRCSSESTLVKMSNCLKFHAAAHITLCVKYATFFTFRKFNIIRTEFKAMFQTIITLFSKEAIFLKRILNIYIICIAQ